MLSVWCCSYRSRQPLQDLQRLLGRWLADVDGGEAPLERGILLDALAVVVVGGRADQAQLTARQGRLEHVGGVERALGVARAHQRVELVDEQDDLAVGRLGLGHDALQPLLELAAELGAGDEQAHVERDQALALERGGHLARRDALGQALDHGGLADARLADQHRVVLGAAHEHLHQAQDLVLAPDDRVELAFAGERGQVHAVLLERLEGALGGRAVDLAPAANLLEGPGERLAAQASGRGRLGERVVGVGQQGEQQVLGAGELVATPLGVGQRRGDRGMRAGGDVEGARRVRRDRAASELVAQPLEQACGVEAVATAGRQPEPGRRDHRAAPARGARRRAGYGEDGAGAAGRWPALCAPLR